MPAVLSRSRVERRPVVLRRWPNIAIDRRTSAVARFHSNRGSPKIAHALSMLAPPLTRVDSVTTASMMAPSTGGNSYRHRMPSAIGPDRTWINGKGHMAPVCRGHLHCDGELNPRGVILPDLRRKGARAVESRAGWNGHAILDAGRRVAEKCLERLVPQVQWDRSSGRPMIVAVSEPSAHG